MKPKNNVRSAIKDLAKSFSDIFSHYTRQTRDKAFNKLIDSEKGRKEIKKLLANPKKPLNQFVKLTFKEWLKQKESF